MQPNMHDFIGKIKDSLFFFFFYSNQTTLAQARYDSWLFIVQQGVIGFIYCSTQCEREKCTRGSFKALSLSGIHTHPLIALGFRPHYGYYYGLRGRSRGPQKCHLKHMKDNDTSLLFKDAELGVWGDSVFLFNPFMFVDFHFMDLCFSWTSDYVYGLFRLQVCFGFSFGFDSVLPPCPLCFPSSLPHSAPLRFFPSVLGFLLVRTLFPLFCYNKHLRCPWYLHLRLLFNICRVCCCARTRTHEPTRLVVTVNHWVRDWYHHRIHWVLYLLKRIWISAVQKTKQNKNKLSQIKINCN